MVETIKPTTTKKEYILEDKDYLLIKAIMNLTIEIKRLRNRIHGR